MAVRLLVDAMNVIGSRPDKWWNDPDRAMRALAGRLDEYSKISRKPLTVVFDRAPVDLERPGHIELVVARRKGRNAADHEIEVLVENDPDPSTIRVVTSDRRLAERVRALGAGVIPAGAFRARMDEALSIRDEG